MGDGRYTADPAKAEAAVEAMETLAEYVFNMGVRLRNGVNFEALGDDEAFGAKAKPVAIHLIDQIATGTEAASRLLSAIPTGLRANQRSVLHQQGRVNTAIQDSLSRGGWRTPGFGGRR